jgi:hypothetical protein
MSFQAYLDNVYAKTGKTPDDFRKLAAEKGLTKYGEITAWLKADNGLGGGHANVIAQLIVNPEKFSANLMTRSPRISRGIKQNGVSHLTPWLRRSTSLVPI